MTGPIVVGNPTDALLALVGDLGAAGERDGTVIWSDSLALRAATDALMPVGWDALLVDPEDEPLSTAAMSHRAQIHGVPGAVIVLCDEDPSLVDVTTMVLRHLPEVPLILTGPGADAAAADLTPVAEDLEIALHSAPERQAALTVLNELSHSAATQPKGS
jgi:hypothetical protein